MEFNGKASELIAYSELETVIDSGVQCHVIFNDVHYFCICKIADTYNIKFIPSDKTVVLATFAELYANLVYIEQFLD
jgi:hypothetical protein